MPTESTSIHSQLREAEAFLRANKLADAIALYEGICHQHNSEAEHWFRLGQLRCQAGEYAKAEHCFRTAAQLPPASALVFHALGYALHKQGQTREAVEYYQRSIQLEPALVDAHYHLAIALVELGQLQGGVDAYRKLLEFRADHVAALSNLGMLLKSMGRVDEAIDALEKAHVLRPASVEVLTNLGNACVLKGHQSRALDLLGRAIHIQPDFYAAHKSLGDALFAFNKSEDALKSYDAALSLQPAALPAIVGKANVLEKSGKYEEAYRLLSPFIEGGNNKDTGVDAAIIYFNLSGHFGVREKALALVREILSRKDIPDAAAMRLYFCLARHYDRSGVYEEACQYMLKANALHARTFDIAAMRSQFDEIIATYSEGFVRDMPCADNDSACPVFFVGMPRSGTTLVEQIIAAHPQVHGAGELKAVDEIAAWLATHYSRGKPYPAFVSRLPQATIDGVSARHLKVLAGLSGNAARVTDKMPQNFIYIGLIAQLFPSASIIHCVRHPMDTGLSCFLGHFGNVGHDYSYDLDILGAYYIEYRRLMNHWTAVLGDRILDISYENLVTNQESTSRRMFDFCGLEWDDRCLDFHTTGRAVNTLSYEQVRQPIHARSVGKWKNYRDCLQPLVQVLESAGVDV